MVPSSYDECLLHTNREDSFGVVGMQTDDTLILGDDAFIQREDTELRRAGLQAKPVIELSPENPLEFNGCTLSMYDDHIRLTQKGQGKKLELVDLASRTKFEDYRQQRARGAYISSICQPEAAFDLCTAAQHQEPSYEEIKMLNSRVRWQAENIDRGISYEVLDLEKAGLYVFVDGSFANNKDLSSQIGYEIILGNETEVGSSFDLHGNLIHWSCTKSKRVTRSVLASEIYAMVSGVDMAIVLRTTLNAILEQVGMPSIPLIVCTDSYSLYECLVKLGTTKEKRLMIDIMALRQSYETRELTEVRWIYGEDNPTDAMTKSKPNSALASFLDNNKLNIRVQGSVKRKE